MLVKLKKFFGSLFVTDTVKRTEEHNTELCRELRKLLYEVKLERALNDPVNKMYLMRMYSSSMDDLLHNLLTRRSISYIIAIDIGSFMKGTDSSIAIILGRIIPLLEKNKVSSIVSHDLFEFITICNFILKE